MMSKYSNWGFISRQRRDWERALIVSAECNGRPSLEELVGLKKILKEVRRDALLSVKMREMCGR